MIVEHEIIEQIEEDRHGWPLKSVCDLARRLGKSDPMIVLKQMCVAGYLELADASGRTLQPWECDQVWRARGESVELRVVATQLGSEWVHG